MISPEPSIRRMVEPLSAAREGGDARSIHQVRVAAGRLAVWLALGGRRILRDDLRWLRRALAPVRDLDVLIAEHPLATWARGLESERAARHAELARALDEPRLVGLLSALHASKPIATDRARKGLARLRRKVIAAGDELAREEHDLDALHALRRRLRHLRYAHEWLGEEAADLVELQDALGALNNLVVALDHLDLVARRDDRAIELASERAALVEAVERQRVAALAAWRATAPKLADAA